MNFQYLSKYVDDIDSITEKDLISAAKKIVSSDYIYSLIEPAP